MIFGKLKFRCIQNYLILFKIKATHLGAFLISYRLKRPIIIKLYMKTLAIHFIVSINCYVDYSGYKLIEVQKNDITISEVDKQNLDVWNHGKTTLEILISQAQLKEFKNDYNIINKNIQFSIYKANLRSISHDWFANYHSYDEIIDWLSNKSDKHKDIMELIPSIGITHENRTIPVVKIKSSLVKSNKKIVWIQG